MRWIGITLSLALPLACYAQESPTLLTGKEATRPTAADSAVVKKAATAWIDRRANEDKWKSNSFLFVGTLAGRPADELPKTRYDVYKMTFSVSPQVGSEPQGDMLFYAKGKDLIWPPEQWSRLRPPPGQNLSAVRFHAINK